MKTLYSQLVQFRLRFLLAIAAMFILSGLSAQKTNTAAGNWSNPAIWSPAGVPGPGDDVVLSATGTASTVIVDVPTVSINSLTIGSNRTLNIGAGNTDKFEVLGAVLVQAGGKFDDPNSVGVNRFSGGITNNSTNSFSSSSPVEFFGSNQSIAGSGQVNLLGNVTITDNIQVVNNSSNATNGLYIGGNLDGSGIASSFVNNTLLRYNGAAMPFASGGILNASNVGNTFKYVRTGDQIIRPTIYHHLAIEGSGNKNFTDVNITGNFTATANALAVQSGGTLRFSGNTNTTYSNPNSPVPVWNDVVVEKTGAQIQLNNSLTANTLTIAQGTLHMGATARNLIVNSDFAGAGTLDASGANHTIRLCGANNSIGNFITGSAVPTVQYSSLVDADPQIMFGSPNYKNIVLLESGTGPKVLGGPITFNGSFTWRGNYQVELGPFDLTIGPSGTLRSRNNTDASNVSWTAANTANRMFVTEGAGKVVIAKTAASGFTTFNSTYTSPATAGYLPIGANGIANGFYLTSFAATVTGTGRIEVRVVPARQPNIPYYNFALQKYWQIQTVNLSGITANANFYFSTATGGDVIGAVTGYVPVRYDGVGLVTPTGPSAPGAQPFATTGTNVLAGDWTAYDPAVRTTLYSYQSGDWNDPLTWTTDPSGTTSVIPLVPGTGDAVVILNGRNVYTDIPRSVASVVIQDGGTLDLKGTTGNSLGTISGQGTLRLSSVNLPAGNIAPFVAVNGGTIEYYNLPAGNHVLPTTAPFTNTYNNLQITSTNGISFTINTNANIVLNGNFSMSRSGVGVPSFRIGNTASNRTFTVNGNFNVGAGCVFGPSTSYNGDHSMTIVGNSTVSGTAHFTNGTYNNGATGRISLTLSGLSQNTSFIAASGSSVRFWEVTMNKTEGAEVFINGSPGAIEFYRNPGVRLLNNSGTMRLGSGIDITLGTTDGTNYQIGQANRFPVLWVDGATVKFGGNNSIVPYGTLKVTGGSVDLITDAPAGSAKTITLRENGLLEVSGGVVTAACLRVSTLDDETHRGAFILSGGTVNITGASGPVGSYASFALPYEENVFKMTGGVLNVSRQFNSGIAGTGGFHVGSSSQNYTVTGGQVNIYTTDNNYFDIASSTPFYNLNIYKVGTGANGKVRLKAFNWSYNGAAANTISSGSYPLVVLNNLVLQSTGSPIFDAGEQDVIVHGQMTINSGATYISGNNTLRFVGTAAQTFTVNGSTTFFGSDNNLLNGPEDIVNGANYTVDNMTVTQNVEEAPDGTMSAERFLETTTNGLHRFYSPIVPTSGLVTGSVFVKPNGRNVVAMRLGANFNVDLAYYDLTGPGSVISYGGAIVSASVSNEGNGWYRISATANGASNLRMAVHTCSAPGVTTFAGNPSLGFFVWGAMLQSTPILEPYTPISASGINSMEVNKPGSSTLTLALSGTALNLNGSLNLTSGLLDIGSKTIAVRGNVDNNTEIVATSSGRVRLNGTNVQNISGNGSGIFPYIVLANSGGAAGNIRYTATSNFVVNRGMEFTTDRIFDIANKRISFTAAATLTSTTGSFSNNRFIKTSGFLSDGGIAKEYSGSVTSFAYHFGTGTNYTPATIAFTSAPANWGTLNVRPVSSKHLYVTDPDALEYYWKVNQTGFSGIAANSLNMQFVYGSDLADNLSYIPAYYNYQDIAYTAINDVNEVVEATNTIRINPFSKLEGDFTAGNFDAFGAVVPFYSRQSGAWNNPTTWSNTGHGGAAASGTPGASNPVYIGDGVSYNHTVTVSSNNTFAGSLIVDNGSTLNLGSTTGHNFGALPYSTAGGAGTIRISSSTPVAEFPGGDFGLFFTEQGGTAEYYGTGTSFVLPTQTAAPNSLVIESYKNLRIASSGTNRIDFADQNLEILQNLTINGAAGSIAGFSDIQPRQIDVKGNLVVNQGILEFPSNSEQTINVEGNVTVASNGVMRGASTGSVIHEINLKGGLVNNGTIDFNTSSPVALKMVGNASSTISGTNGSAQLTFGPLYINKGTDQSLDVNITSLGSMSAPSHGWLNLQNGTLRISRAGSLTLSNQPDVDFFIPSTAALVLNHSGLTLTAGAASSNASDLILAGRLELIAGTMNIGLSSNDNHNDIEYAASGTPQIIVSGNSTLNVNGQIRRSVNVLLGALSYTQSGNSTVLIRGKMPEATSFNLNRAKFEVLNEGSQFSMSDNALLIIDRAGAQTNIYGDIHLAPASGSISGGEIVVGTGNTGSNALFEINSQIPLWNLTVDGTGTNKTLRLLGNPINIRRNLAVRGLSTFNANSLDVQIGGNLIVENTSASTGLNTGGYQVISTAQTTTFNSSTGNQSITGTGSNLINFANLVVNNTGGSVSLNGGVALRVASNLSLLSGNFSTGTSLVTVLGNVVNNVSHTSSTGGYIVLNGASAQTISGSGSGQFGNLRLNNNAGAEILNSTRVNGDLNLVSGIFYINNQLLTLGTSATVTSPGALDENRMIRVNGVSSDAGVRKMYGPTNGSFTFPIGVTLKYTPVTIAVGANSAAGSVTVKPVNAKHPGTTFAADNELAYYWITSGTGFSPAATYTHTYNYVQPDATNGDESLYVAGRYFSNQWVPQNGIPGTVNAATNRIVLSGVSYINGEFTAGEPQEFGDIQVYYSRANGDWTDPNSWSTDPVLQHTGAPALVAPMFNPIVIHSSHTIVGNTNNLSAPTSEINGLLNLNNTIGHNFGVVTGTGTIRMTPTGSNEFVFPGGTYSGFTAAGTGTIEYSSTGTAALPSRTTYNNIRFTGAGNKNLFNSDIIVNGNFNIQAGQVSNPSNRLINLYGDFENYAGFNAFNGGSGSVVLAGVNQAFTGSTQFSNLVVNGGGIKTLNASIQINANLNLTSGIIETGGNLVIIPVAGTVTNASAASYVNGNLQKAMNNTTTSKQFEVGDATAYTPVSLSFASVGGTGNLTVFTTSGDHAEIGSSGLNPVKSVNRVWNIANSGLSIPSYSATFTFSSADLDGGTNTSLLDVACRTAGSWTVQNSGVRTSLTTQAVGITTFGDFQIGEQLTAGLTWTGAVSNDWNNPNNWLPTNVPGVNDDITIPNTTNKPNFPTFVNGVCRNAVFETGASITIPTGVTLTVGGNWTGANTVVNGGGTIQFTSPAATLSGSTTVHGIVAVSTGANLITNNGLTLSNTGILMHGAGTPGAGGAVTGNVVISRQGFTTNRYNYWSSPIVNRQFNFGANRYVYNPAAATAPSGPGLLAGWQGVTGSMTPGKGYIATNSGTVNFNGLPNNGNVSHGPMVIGTHTSANLIGNPYPSPISAASFVSANPHISGGAIYLWDDDNSAGADYDPSDYVTWNGIGVVGPNTSRPFNGNIAVAQGFFVNVSSTSPMQFTNAMRTSASATFFEAEPVQRLWLNVTTQSNEYNETLLGFKADATDGEDHQYDAAKLKGNANLAFFTYIGSKEYAIQALHTLNSDKIIDLGIEATAAEIQTINLKAIENLDESVMVILEDKKLGKFHDLRTGGYNYSYNPQTDVKRFRLHLNAGVEVSTVSESCSGNDGELKIVNKSKTGWNLTVKNEQGEVVESRTNFVGAAYINNLPAGNYIAEFSNEFGMYMQRTIRVASESMTVNVGVVNAAVAHEAINFTADVDGVTSIIWSFGDGVISSDINPVHAYTEPGVYTVSFTASNSSCTVTERFTVVVTDESTGINKVNEGGFVVYPNPVNNGVLNVRFADAPGSTQISVVDAAGKLVVNEVYSGINSSVVSLNLGHLQSGVYQVVIRSGDSVRATRVSVLN